MATGTSGWKARQERARAKMTHGKTKAERDAVRAERNRVYAKHSGVQQGKTTNDEREQLVQALMDAGETKPGSNTKLETLRKRVEALNGEQADN